MLAILQETDPVGLEILSKKCSHVPFSESEYMKALENEYRETCRANGGIGLAANQCGSTWRFFYLDRPFLDGLAINPRIVSTTGCKSVSKEGCLSRKGMPAKKTLRYQSIRVRYETLDGETHDEFLKGDDAVVFQHELDHLNGILI